jgi:hypothetical protein
VAPSVSHLRRVPGRLQALRERREGMQKLAMKTKAKVVISRLKGKLAVKGIGGWAKLYPERRHGYLRVLARHAIPDLSDDNSLSTIYQQLELTLLSSQLISPC